MWNKKQEDALEHLEFAIKDFAEEWLTLKLVLKDDAIAKKFAQELARIVETLPIGVVIEMLEMKTVKTMITHFRPEWVCEFARVCPTSSLN